jgi:hypothetical protein
MRKIRKAQIKTGHPFLSGWPVFLNRLSLLADEGAHLLLELGRNAGHAMFLSAMFRGGFHHLFDGIAPRNEVTIDPGLSTAEHFHVAPPLLGGKSF